MRLSADHCFFGGEMAAHELPHAWCSPTCARGGDPDILETLMEEFEVPGLCTRATKRIEARLCRGSSRLDDQR